MPQIIHGTFQIVFRVREWEILAYTFFILVHKIVNTTFCKSVFTYEYQ